MVMRSLGVLYNPLQINPTRLTNVPIVKIKFKHNSPFLSRTAMETADTVKIRQAVSSVYTV